MKQTVDLRKKSGEKCTIAMPLAGDFDSIYALSCEYSGSDQFVHLLTNLFAVVDWPFYALNQALRAEKVHFGELDNASKEMLLSQRGYGLGVLFDVEKILHATPINRCQKLLFLRDPRDLIIAQYHYKRTHTKNIETFSPLNFQVFLASKYTGQLVERYKRFAAYRLSSRKVTLVRYELALEGWHRIASDVVIALDLPIDPKEVASIAALAPPIGDRLPSPSGQPYERPIGGSEILSLSDAAALEDRFADVLPAFGYSPRVRLRSTPAVKAVSAFVAPLSSVRSSERNEPALRNAQGWLRPVGLTEFDSVLHSRLKPNARATMDILGRRVLMDVDQSGHRPVCGQPAVGDKTLAVYGCSFTFGTAVPADETFCSQLQRRFPNSRIENHGVPGYSASRNLLQLQREIRWNQAEFVTFCWIPDHQRRNVSALRWVQLISANRKDRNSKLDPEAQLAGSPPAEHMPRAALDTEGGLTMRYVKIPGQEIVGIDFSDFDHDPYYLDLVSFRLFQRAHEIVTGYGGEFFVTVLQGKLSSCLTGCMAKAGIPIVDAGLSGRDYVCLPDDPHPNTLAHRIYCDRIGDYLNGRLSGV